MMIRQMELVNAILMEISRQADEYGVDDLVTTHKLNIVIEAADVVVAGWSEGERDESAMS